jgi:hypothetical protein
LTSGFSADRPASDNIFYLQDTDQNKAIWASADEAPDQWTAQFFSSGVERGMLNEYFPFNSGHFLKSPAPVVRLPAPEARLLKDSTSDGVRTLHLRILSPRRAPLIHICVESDEQLMAASINGKSLSEKTAARLIGKYFAPPADGVELILKTRPAQLIKIKLVDGSYELPVSAEINVSQRPDSLSPAPYLNGDSTYVSKSFTF